MLTEKHNIVENECFYSKLNSTPTHQIWLPGCELWLIPATYATGRQICFWPAWTSTQTVTNFRFHMLGITVVPGELLASHERFVLFIFNW